MTKSLKVLSIAALALVAAATLAQAEDTVKVKVPFAFMVAGQQLPAGSYTFVRDSSPRTVQVFSDTHKLLAIAPGLVEPTRSLAAELTFHKHGEQYFLKTVSGNGTELALPTSHADRVAEAAQGTAPIAAQ
jgi:hypothetical protein